MKYLVLVCLFITNSLFAKGQLFEVYEDFDTRHEKIIVVGEGELADEPAQDLPRIEKSLIMFFKFNDSERVFVKRRQMQDLLDNGFEKFFNMMSDFRVKSIATATDWYQLDRDGEDDNSSRFCFVKNSEIKEAAEAMGFNLADYDNVATISNCADRPTIGGYASLGKWDWLNIGKAQSYIKMSSAPERLTVLENPLVPYWSSFIGILSHERGHNFGLYHSNGLDCGEQKYLQGCTIVSYGNHFDRMGSPDGSLTFNADQQRRAGFKDKNKHFLHIKESGNFEIERLTSLKREKKIAAYIYLENTDQKLFMVEYRQPDLYDGNLASWVFRNVSNGVHLYSSLGGSLPSMSPNFTTSFQYIDSNPTALNWHDDTAYESLTGSYVDQMSGITIKMDGVTGTKAKFSVIYNSKNGVCFKTSLSNWTERPYVTRYFPIEESVNDKYRSLGKMTNSQTLKGKHITLIPGDIFKFNYETKIGDHIMCPRTKINYEWANDQSFSSWVNLATKDRVDPNSGGTGHDNPPPVLNGSMTYPNYDRNFQLRELKVPVEALGKDYTLIFKAKDLVTGKEIQYPVQLHIRESHSEMINLNIKN
ncbi:MAG: hypothetical protein ACI9QD_001073 [Thermoproteota archaeon]|jgi:hypothetical protein